MNLGDLVRCFPSEPSGVPLADVEAAIRLVPHEPATWHGNTSGRREDWKWSDVPWHITRFGHVETVEQYLEELDAFCAPTLPLAPGSDPSAAPAGLPHQWTALLHPGLQAHIAHLLEGEHWASAVRESAAYLEHELRCRALLDSTLLGVDLVTAAMKPARGPLALPRSGPAAEQEGWHSLARGFMGAIRNRFASTMVRASGRERARRSSLVDQGVAGPACGVEGVGLAVRRATP